MFSKLFKMLKTFEDFAKSLINTNFSQFIENIYKMQD